MIKKIGGIQQIGIGNSDIQVSWKWYRKYFGMNIPVFEDTADAALMYKYTGNKVYNRHAILALNLQGGAGFELWQFTDRKPTNPAQPIKIGDYGLQIVKIKTLNIQKTFQFFKEENLDLKSGLEKNPRGELHFYLQDPYQNLFEIIESKNWFCNKKLLTGGVNGIVIGVSDIEKSIKLYADILGYSKVIYDEKKAFSDFKGLNGGDGIFRRVLLRHPEEKTGGFSKFFGATEVELIERQDKEGIKIYQNRYWGDCGFIHVCFDVIGMNKLKQECTKAGFPFTVDSENSFDMGEAAGRFSYIEDPDGTLIEFVETHKVPILKIFGWYLNLKNRNPEKNIPDWMVKLMGLNGVKD